MIEIGSSVDVAGMTGTVTAVHINRRGRPAAYTVRLAGGGERKYAAAMVLAQTKWAAPDPSAFSERVTDYYGDVRRMLRR